MKVGILGSGNVGMALASGFVKHGHNVMIASREPGKLAQWSSQHPRVLTGTPKEAAQFAELGVLSVKGIAAAEMLRLAGESNLSRKIVIDATNPLTDEPPVSGVLKFFTKLDESLMELLQKEFLQIRFVKAFNSVGSALMVNPQFPGGKPTMFICGNDSSAKQVVSEILDQFGWETENMGQVEAARAIEPLCMLWCIPGFLHNQWGHAFKLLK